MGVKERRERERSETRDKILDAARELFLTHGYDGVSMRKVAEAIEYSPTAIYVHFADKEELFRDLCYEDFAKLAQIFQQAEPSSDPIERLRFIGRTYADFGLQFPNHYKLMFMTTHPAVPLDDRDHKTRGNPESDAYAFLKLTVAEAIRQGRLREDLTDADLVSQTLWAGIHGVISLHIAKSHDAWVDWRPVKQRIETMLDFNMRAIVREAK